MALITCDRHPSARAQIIATRYNESSDDVEALTFCGHCNQVNAGQLLIDGWTLETLEAGE